MYLLILGRKEGRERDRDRERHWNERETFNWLPPTPTLTGDQTRNLGMCPDQELNSHIFTVQDDAPTNWAAWPGLKLLFLYLLSTLCSTLCPRRLLLWLYPPLPSGFWLLSTRSRLWQIRGKRRPDRQAFLPCFGAVALAAVTSLHHCPSCSVPAPVTLPCPLSLWPQHSLLGSHNFCKKALH